MSQDSHMKEQTKQQTLKEQIEAEFKKPMEFESQLNENLSWAGKLFFASLAAYIAGDVASKVMPIKLKGSQDQVKAVVDAVVASKAFQDAAKQPGARVEDIIKKLNLKNMNKQRFEQMTGKRWPL